MSYYQTIKIALHAVSVIFLLANTVIAGDDASLWKAFESRAAKNSKAAWTYYGSLDAPKKLKCTLRMASATEAIKHQELAYMLFTRMIESYADSDGSDVKAVIETLDAPATPIAWKKYLFAMLSSRRPWRGKEEAQFQSRAIEIGLAPTNEYALRSLAASYACRTSVRIAARIAADNVRSIGANAGTFEKWAARLSNEDSARGKEQIVRIHMLLAAVPAIIKEKGQSYHIAYSICRTLGTGKWVETGKYVDILKQVAAGEHDESAKERARAAACCAILDPNAIGKKMIESIGLSGVDAETRWYLGTPDLHRYAWSERARRSMSRTQAATRPATTSAPSK